MRWLEIGGRAYPLRFTAAAILRVQEQTGASFSALFERGAAGLCALLYCALCDGLPRLTLLRAAALLESALRDHTPQEIADAVLLALIDSGFDRRGTTRAEVERLQAAAARAGCPAPEALPGLTLREIDRRLTALRAPCGPQRAPAPMTDEEMRNVLERFAGRLDHDHT